jgi:tetratricopeptide (TPR) repeat protein
MSRGIIMVLLLLLGTAGAVRADLAADFAAANQLYAQGKFPAAAAGYEKILATGLQSPALWFNDANAEFKAGHPGRAIAAYRRAALLAPRDAEVRANLQFVRNQIQSGSVREARWQSALGTLSLGEWTGLTVFGFWLTLGLLTVWQIRPALVSRLKSLTWTAGALTLFFGMLLGVQAAGHFGRATAVVTIAQAARTGPFEDAQTTFTPHDGAELTVLDRHDWVQVTDGAGRTGWLPLNGVEVLPGA